MEIPRPQESVPALLNSNPRQLVTSIIKSLSATSAATSTQNPLKEITSDGKNLFLTLYALFEKELLPALDCLDRGLVTRLKISTSLGHQTLFLVRSAQQHHTRHGTFENVNHYEVRLDAWSCSCPAFTFSAFPASEAGKLEDSGLEEPWLFGGLSRGRDLPVCKHVLACVLVQHFADFGSFVDEREVSKEEFAGWAAGWGG